MLLLLLLAIGLGEILVFRISVDACLVTKHVDIKFDCSKETRQRSQITSQFYLVTGQLNRRNLIERPTACLRRDVVAVHGRPLLKQVIGFFVFL